MCRMSDGAAVAATGPASVVNLRRSSVPLYGRGNKNVEPDSVISLHRDPLHRRNMLMWRQHWQPPASHNRLHDNNVNGQ